MTYQHALRYLFENSASVNQDPSPSLASLRSTVGKSDIPLLCLFFIQVSICTGCASAASIPALSHSCPLSYRPHPPCCSRAGWVTWNTGPAVSDAAGCSSSFRFALLSPSPPPVIRGASSSKGGGRLFGFWLMCSFSSLLPSLETFHHLHQIPIWNF